MASSFVRSASHLASDIIRHASSRLELLGLELAEERERVIAILIAALMSCFFVWLAVVFAALLVVAFYWDTAHRLQAIGWMAGGSLVVAIVGVSFLMKRLKRPTALFSHSLAEFDKDRRALESLE
jgi:uncharacterized membrane protein YqjE